MKRFVKLLMLFASIAGLCLFWQPRATLAATTPDTTVDYKIVNQNSGLVLGISAASRTAGATALQWQDTGAADHLWHFLPGGSGTFKIENMNSGEILGISNASQSAGAAVLQWADNATNDHLWQFVDEGNGLFKIVNQNSNLVLGISGASRQAGASAVQETDNGTTDQRWRLVSTGMPAYVNPGAVSGSVTVHDPAMVRTANGTYYLFSTTITSGRGIEMRSSTDRIHFTDAGNAFTTIPAWTNTYTHGSGALWAPDISFHNGKYWLYYAASSFGSNNSAIGLATSTTAAPGSWVDQGLVYSSSSSSNFNAIDPGLTVDSSGRWWLTLGSFWSGIQLIQLDPTTGKQLSSNQTRTATASRTSPDAIEGSYIYPHGGFYYLFASIDQCCNGVNSTYHIIVGRSTSITGPYVDRGGIQMTQGGGTILLSTHGNIIGPGGQTVMHDQDGDLLVYHYYNGNNNGTPTLGLNLLGWDAQGWPFVL